MELIQNKVAESGLITIDLERYLPEDTMVLIDLKQFLFMQMILKEKEFREQLDQHDWSAYAQKDVVVHCTVDAIIPMWAYMLITNRLSAYARTVYTGTPEEAIKQKTIHAIQSIDIEQYRDKRVVIKGCGEKEVPNYAYAEITNLLSPVVKSLMYGEACSTVPVYKRK
ncbi:MAG: DUF2480 family protein [Chitinophagaceae bacterium]|jgi:hypothetical protein